MTRLTLNRLGRGPTEAIVARLAGGQDLPPEVLGEIAARTDGVPLFVEELTKAVLEAGTAGSRAAVPASLHASLMARLDRVPGVKEVAQVAACIGREFAYPLLAAVSPVPEPELRAALDRLAAAELVFARGEPPEASYTFKHALVRDAAHESLLKAQRQELHARIARVLEERFPETADDRARAARPALAEAGLAERAVDYWQRAGQRALARSAMAEAVAHLTRGWRCWPSCLSMPGPDDASSACSSRWARRRSPRRASRRRRRAAPTPGLASCAASWAMSRSSSRPCTATSSSTSARRAGRRTRPRGSCALGRGAGRYRRAVTGHRMVGAALYQLGRLAESRAHLAGADPVRPRRDQPRPSSTPSTRAWSACSGSSTSCWRSVIRSRPGQAMEEALAYARELAHPYTLAYALSVACIYHGRHRAGSEGGGDGGRAGRPGSGAGLPPAGGGGQRGPGLGADEQGNGRGSDRTHEAGLGQLPGDGGGTLGARLPRPARSGVRLGGPARRRPGARSRNFGSN